MFCVAGLWTFGYGGQGQLGTGNKENTYGPKRVHLPSSSARPVNVVSENILEIST